MTEGGRDGWGDYIHDHVPTVSARFVPTGLLNHLGQPILRLRSRPVGFRADLDKPIYAVDEEHPPRHD